MKNKFHLWGYGLYLIIAIITSVPFFIKHFNNFPVFIVIYAFMITFLVLIIHFVKLNKFNFLNNNFPWIFLIMTLTILNILLYPQTRVVPSTAPNALMEPAITLIRTGLNPYSVKLFDGAPISPGPGWILLNSLFSLSGLITLLTPVYLIWVGFMLSKWSKTYTFVFTALLFSTMSFLQMSFTGHDLPAVSLAVVGLALMLHRYYNNKKVLNILAVLSGLIATARIPFIIFPLLLSICLATLDRRRAKYFALLSTGLAVVIHVIFYLWAIKDNLFYQPLHVFGRASQGSSIGFLGFGAAIWMVASLYMLKKLSNEPSSWLAFLWTSFSVPFIFVGLGELIPDGPFSLDLWVTWEGKGYIMFTLPILLASLVLLSSKPSNGKVNLDTEIR